MAIAQSSALSKSKNSPLSSSSKRKALEIKERLFRKKTATNHPSRKKPKKVTFDLPRKALVSYEHKAGSTKSTIAPPDSQAKSMAHKVASNKSTIAPPDSQAKSMAMARAQEVQANLSPEFPSFIKPMLPSHVTGGFWLSFPKPFCDLHLPKHDETVVLVDEREQESETKYLIEKNGLSAGWRGFSIAHKLLEGDALVFQLVKPCKFKVYIVRVNGLTELDGAIGLLSLDACAKPVPMAICGVEKDEKNHGKELGSDPISVDSHQENSKEEGMMGLDQSGNDSDDSGSEVLEGIRFSQSVVDFKDVKGIEDFNILVDGLIIDSEIPKHLQIKYYDLCRSQGSYLHDCLLEGLNIKLIAGIISETVNIADAIRACKLTTTRADFGIWDTTLKAFEELGMKVGFLRARIQKLVNLLFESEQIIEAKRAELVKAKEEMTSIEQKLCGVRLVIRNLDAEMESLKLKSAKLNSAKLEPAFRNEANAPWGKVRYALIYGTLPC